jgi:dTDP-4-dehydrorhamnose reductase
MVRPLSTADLQPPRPAPRPANSVLENSVLAGAGYTLMRDHRDALNETVSFLLGA